MTKKAKKNTKKEQKPKATLEATEVEVVEEDDLLPYNPLIHKPITITPEEESEQKVQLIEKLNPLWSLTTKLKAEQQNKTN